MRISDWSSDVCSSDLVALRQAGPHVEAAAVDALDLPGPAHGGIAAVAAREPGHAVDRLAASCHFGVHSPAWIAALPPARPGPYILACPYRNKPGGAGARSGQPSPEDQIGRAACRERGCQSE